MWEKIVLNLLSNALKFTLEGEIGVRLRSAGDFVTLEVQDTGAGIPAAELPHVFERFHRVHGTPARTHEGTGIGLALVKDLVGLHGGSVAVDSEPGRGTRFVITLRTGTAHLPEEQIRPQAASGSRSTAATAFVEEALRWLPDAAHDQQAGPFAQPHATTAAEEQLATPRPHVLIVDDNADMRAYSARLLSRDYLVDVAADGQAALARIAERLPELVIADVMMPRLDGLGLLAALRQDERTRTLPVILLSARAGEESTIEGLRAGADDYLVKPFTAGELLARVRTHLKLARARSAEHERIVAAIEAERHRLFELFESAPAISAVLRGPDHVFEAANAAYREVVGGRELIGLPARQALPEVEGQGYFELLDRVYRSGEPYAGSEGRMLLRNGSTTELEEHYFNFVYQPLRDLDGNVSGVLVHGVDVTRQVKARLEIDELYQRVREANEAKSAFLAAVSHELRTPLNAVLGYADVLTYGVHGPLLAEQREDIERIQAASRYLLSLINDILNFARVEAGQMEFRIGDAVAGALLDNVCELMTIPIRQKGITFRVASPPPAVRVRADAERAKQALLNLLGNAVKFTDTGGTITLDTTLGDRTLHIHVRDTGPGIADDQLHRIFDPFVQLDRSGSGNSLAGVGLGLAISRDLARRMGGDISVESHPGVGSVFTLTLPLADA
jgi:signal transduction histidine kinase/CheY-like chemotaxis protein